MKTIIRILENALDYLRQEDKTNTEKLQDMINYLEDTNNPYIIGNIKKRLAKTIVIYTIETLGQLIDKYQKEDKEFDDQEEG